MRTKNRPDGKEQAEGKIQERLSTLPDGYYRTREIAKALGVTTRAISMAGAHKPELRAQAMTYIGRRQVKLFTTEQVEALGKHFEANKGKGRKRIWTLAESERRSREYGLARYYQRRAETLAEKGKQEEAEIAQKRGDELIAKLEEELIKRVGKKATERPRPPVPNMREEYHMTLRVLAVVCERLLSLTEAERVEIGDAAIRDSPDLIASRDTELGRIVIRVER
jgi:hypothetical protein